MNTVCKTIPVWGTIAALLPLAGLPAIAVAAESPAPPPAAAGPLKSTLVVAADGSGDYKTLQEALAVVPSKSTARVLIHLKPGKYQGPFIVPQDKPNLVLEGEDARTTVLTWDHNVYEPIPEGSDKFNPCVQIKANDFEASNLTIENTSGDHGQALALRVDSDRVIFRHCRMLGWQDTVMVNNGRQYFQDCYIEGRVDFIYGSGTAVLEDCEIHSKNGGYVTAASTPQDKPFGFVFLNCRLTGDPAPWINPATGQPDPKNRPGADAYLGRPWRPYGSVAYINCQMSGHILPAGWNNWGKAENEQTARYAEFGSKTPDGKPLDVSKRAPWAKQLTAEEAARYTVANVLGGTDNWNPASAPANTVAARAQVRIVLAGDSTVTDDAGWGAGFKQRLKPGVELINLAKGGRSSGSFMAEGRWKQTLDLKPDYVLIQFGHNDQPGHGPERETDPKTTYRANMERYVDEAKAAGIKPILVTSLSRRQWGADGKIHSTLTPYADTVRQIAAEKNVPLIDLHALSIAMYEKMGQKAVEEISPTKTGGLDGTHLNAKGGDLVGRLVADALRQAVPALADYLQPS